MDVRGCYCALAACEMLGLDKAAVGEACGMPAFIRACQVGGGRAGRRRCAACKAAAACWQCCRCPRL